MLLTDCHPVMRAIELRVRIRMRMESLTALASVRVKRNASRSRLSKVPWDPDALLVCVASGLEHRCFFHRPSKEAQRILPIPGNHWTRLYRGELCFWWLMNNIQCQFRFNISTCIVYCTCDTQVGTLLGLCALECCFSISKLRILFWAPQPMHQEFRTKFWWMVQVMSKPIGNCSRACQVWMWL